jgi:YVTN family beta-propeller protein
MGSEMEQIKILAISLLICILSLTQAMGQSAEELYQKGVQLEEIKGDLRKAIDVYSLVIRQCPSDKRNCAMAQLHIGLCYEKLGKENAAAAVAAFKKVVELYGSQKEAVKIAKEKLAMESDDSAIEEIKKSLAEWNKAYESKDLDKYCELLSSQYLNRAGGINKVQEFFRSHYWSVWKQIFVTSSIKSIDKSGYNYVVVENLNIVNIGWNDGKKVEVDVTRLLTFTKDDGVWKISDVQNQIIMPAIYKKLSKDYTGIGKPGLCYVTHISQNFISVIDTKTDSLIGIIPSGSGSCSLAFSPDGQTGYITNFTSNTITVFDKHTNNQITSIPVGTSPSQILITQDGKFALITHESDNGLWVMRTKDNQIINRIPGPLGFPMNDTINHKIYISAISAPYIFVLNPVNQSVLKKIEVGGRPLDIAITPDGRFIYVANCTLNEVEKIDTRLDTVISRIQNIAVARGIAISNDGKYAYVTNVSSKTVTVVDIHNDTIIKTISVRDGPTTVSIDQNSNYAYISNQGNASISVIDIKTNEVVKTIYVAENPIRVLIF